MNNNKDIIDSTELQVFEIKELPCPLIEIRGSMGYLIRPANLARGTCGQRVPLKQIAYSDFIDSLIPERKIDGIFRNRNVTSWNHRGQQTDRGYLM